TELPETSTWPSSTVRMQPLTPHALTALPLMSPFEPTWCWIPLKLNSRNVLLSTSKCGAPGRTFPDASISPDAKTPTSPPVNDLFVTTALAPATVLEPPNTPSPPGPTVKLLLSTAA